MTDTIIVAPLLIPLFTAIATLLARRRLRLQQGVSLLGSVAYLVAVAVLFARVVLPVGSTPRVLVYQVSNWPAPFGISLVADALSVFMLVIAAVVTLAALVFAVVSIQPYGQRLSFHSLYHFLVLGVTGSFLTGDVFNLFVWFEVMLMASYVFVLFYSGPEHTRAALSYVVLNLVGSAVMLLGIGGLYATTGTLNMADLARRLSDPATYGIDVAPVLGLAALLFVVFALKAGLVPLHFWVPDAYAVAPTPITAVLAGVVKKVGIYAIIRLYFTVFSTASLPVFESVLHGTSMLSFFAPVLFVTGAASIIYGGLAAVGSDDLDRLLAYSSIGQVGFIVMPLAVAAAVSDPELRVLGVVAALVYSAAHALAKSLLFLTSGVVSASFGTSSLDQLGGVASWRPSLAGGAFVGMLALVGIPPLLGFFGKLFVFNVAVRVLTTNPVGGQLVLAVTLVGAVLTIAYTTRLWNAVFWGTQTRSTTGVISRRPLTIQLTVVVSLAALVVAFGLGFQLVSVAAHAAAQAATDTGAYINGVGLTEVSR